MRFNKSAFLAAAAAALLSVQFASSAQAAAMLFDIDPAQSSFTVSATVQSLPTTPQTPGSDVITLDGTLLADLDGGNLTFTGGSNIDAQTQPSPLSPAEGGAAGSAEADFGLTGGIAALATANVAGRNFVFDVTGASTAVTDDSFLATGLNLEVLLGVLDYRGSFIGSIYSGSEDLSGASAANLAGTGSLTSDGSVETLTLPINTSYEFEQDGVSGTVSLSGTIVGTRAVAVPEPTTAVALFGFAGMALRRRR